MIVYCNTETLYLKKKKSTFRNPTDLKMGQLISEITKYLKLIDQKTYAKTLDLAFSKLVILNKLPNPVSPRFFRGKTKIDS